MYIPYQKVLSHLDRIQKGDIVYIISDILQWIKITKENGESFDRNLFIDSVIQKVGKEGTILIPTFNWGFCKGRVFDYYHTPSETGALGNAALKRDDFIRTKHPIYSFAVYGKDKNKLFQMDPKNSWGRDTIFDYLVEKRSKSLVIGLPAMAGNTIFHHAEQMVGVPFRFHKDFTADYIDWEGNRERKTYAQYVRFMEYTIQEHTEPLDYILEVMNICDTQIINGIPFRTVLSKEMYDLIVMDIKYNDCRNTYKYEKQKEPKEITEKYEWK